MADDGFIPDNEFKPDESAAAPVAERTPALTPPADPNAVADGFIPDNQFEADEDKYGGGLEQLKAGLEGVAKGATFGLSTGLETALGAKPEDIRGREAANPITHAVGETAGLIGSAFIPGVGEANILREAGEGLGVAAKLGAKIADPVTGELVYKAASPGFVHQVTDLAVRGAFEGALAQGGNEVSEMFAKNPDQTAESAIAHMGIAGVLGGAIGGGLGVASQGLGALKKFDPRFISQLDRPAVEAGELAPSIEASNAPKSIKDTIAEWTAKPKANVKEIDAAADRLGVTAHEGMRFDGQGIQRGEDFLLNSPLTHSGAKRQALYDQTYSGVHRAVDEVLGPEAAASKAQVGEEMVGHLSKGIEDLVAPLKRGYEYLKQYHQAIPLSDKSIPRIVQNLQKMDEMRLSPNSPAGKFISDAIRDLPRIKTVDDLKFVKSSLMDRLGVTASAQERRAAAILGDKLTELEKNSIIRMAQTMKTPEAKQIVLDLIDKRGVLNKQYAEAMTKIGTLSERLGKGKVHGPQDALNFIKDLDPETVVNRLFAKDHSHSLGAFQKDFPEAMDVLRRYQKGALRTKAMTPEGDLSLKKLFNNVGKMEPEYQKALFTAPELQRLRDAELLTREMPKAYNPSGTAHTLNFGHAFGQENILGIPGTGIAYANLRDKGIESFIKQFGNEPRVANAVKLAQATVKGEKAAVNAAKDVFTEGKAPKPEQPSAQNISKLKKLVDKFSQDPAALLKVGPDNVGVPEYAAIIGSTTANAVNYLSSLKPKQVMKNPLDTPREPTPMQNAAYDKALHIAENPMVILDKVKAGTITSKDMIHLQKLYPNLYKNLMGKVSDQMLAHIQKDGTIPYKTRLGLATFFGRAMDSTMTPEAIRAAQPQPQQPLPQQNQQPGVKGPHSYKALNKLPGQYQTPAQARLSDKAGQ